MREERFQPGFDAVPDIPKGFKEMELRMPGDSRHGPRLTGELGLLGDAINKRRDEIEGSYPNLEISPDTVVTLERASYAFKILDALLNSQTKSIIVGDIFEQVESTQGPACRGDLFIKALNDVCGLLDVDKHTA